LSARNAVWPTFAHDPALKKIHRGRAYEACDETVRRAIVKVERRADLFDHALTHATTRSAMVMASIWS
jgi:hypothetical protein